MSLLAHYKLNDDVLDASGNSHHGTPTNVSYVAGKIRQAASFDGTSSYIVLPISSSVTSLTLIGWFRCTGPANVQRFCLDIQTGRVGLAWQRGSVIPNLGLHDGTGWQLFGSTPPQNEWHHVAYVLNAATGKANCYVDTVQSGSELNYTPRAIGGQVRLGVHCTVNSGWFIGYMDDVRLYDEALPLWKIKAIYNFGKGSEEVEPWQRLIRPVIQRTAQSLIGAA